MEPSQEAGPEPGPGFEGCPQQGRPGGGGCGAGCAPPGPGLGNKAPVASLLGGDVRVEGLRRAGRGSRHHRRCGHLLRRCFRGRAGGRADVRGGGGPGAERLGACGPLLAAAGTTGDRVSGHGPPRGIHGARWRRGRGAPELGREPWEGCGLQGTCLGGDWDCKGVG